MNPRPKKVTYKSPYQLLVTFDNNEVKLFDLNNYLQYPVYQPLQDESLCSEATVKYDTVVWNEEIDMDPDRLYLEGKSITS